MGVRCVKKVRSERGAAAVEFALVLPLLSLLLFGMITTGFTYSDHLAITNAVREGARLGASLPVAPDADHPTATAAGWATSVQSRVRDVYFNAGSTITTSQVCVKLVSAAGADVTGAAALGANCGTEPASPSSMATGSCVVKVWVTKPANITLVVAPSLNFNIGADSVAYYGRKGDVCTAD